jgi:hypothetical protein
LFLFPSNWLVNPDGAVFMNASKSWVAAAKLLWGEKNDSNVLSLSPDWALKTPEQRLSFFRT